MFSHWSRPQLSLANHAAPTQTELATRGCVIASFCVDNPSCPCLTSLPLPCSFSAIIIFWFPPPPNPNPPTSLCHPLSVFAPPSSSWHEMWTAPYPLITGPLFTVSSLSTSVALVNGDHQHCIFWDVIDCPKRMVCFSCFKMSTSSNFLSEWGSKKYVFVLDFFLNSGPHPTTERI